MKCYQCGHESEQESTYCPHCGFAAPTPVVSSTGSYPILAALKDPLFLVLCIVTSISCLAVLTADGLPLIQILITVFLWLTYAQSRKDIADAQHLRSISGVVYAEYIIIYVLAGLLAVSGFFISAAFNSIAGNPTALDSLLSNFIDLDDEAISMLTTITSLSGGIITISCIFVAVIMTVVNIFSLRYIHRFAKSVYQSIEKNSMELVHTNAAKVWLIVMTVFSGLSLLGSLGNIPAMVSAAATFATTLIPVLLIHKHFK